MAECENKQVALLSENVLLVISHNQKKIYTWIGKTSSPSSKFACARLNKAVNSIRVLGQCHGSNYDWADEQIDKTEEYLLNAVETAMKQIRSGSAVAVAGISL